MRRFAALPFLVLFALACTPPPEVRVTETNILTGPRFWTGDPQRPWADALLVSEGRIVRVVERGEIPKLLASGGSVRQLPGAVAVPGLTDAHGHLAGYALARRRVELGGAATLEDALARVERFAAAHPDAAWIQGRGWDQNDWPDRAWPDADRLEQVAPGRPIALWRVDGHALWVNRTALAEAGIDAKTPDPPGGLIRRDPNGLPTGILVDEATTLVARRIPAPSRAELASAIEEAGRELASMGLTGLHEMGMEDEPWSVVQELSASGRFPLRIMAYVNVGDPLEKRLREARGPLGDDRLRLLGIKLYVDGALGSRGARLLAPYVDDRGTSGLWVTDPAALDAAVAGQFEANLQPAIHAIGDAANRAALDAIEKGLAAHPAARALRPRVEHVQILDPADVPRFAATGAIASMQPTHATSDMPWVEERLGPERLRGGYAWRSLLDAGAALAFGSDVPIESPDPLPGLYAAVTRQDRDGLPAGGWQPRERLALPQALAAFTSGAAHAVRLDDRLGRLAPGYWCDVTVLDRDIFKEPARALLDTRVTATVVGGQVVWQHGAEKVTAPR